MMSLFEDDICEVVYVVGCVGVFEVFSEVIDENVRVWVFYNNGRVRIILVLNW